LDEEIKFQSVYTTFDRGTIAIIKSLLEANSIDYYVDNEHAASLAAWQVSPLMNVMVPEDQADLAKELLKEIKG